MSHPRDSDPLLVERFEKIYFSTSDRLIAFVKKNTPQKESVDDIVQECYIILWNKLSSLQDDDKVINLLRTIARNMIVDALRKAGREYFRANVFYDQQETIKLTEDDLHMKEVMLFYRKAVDSLPPKRREIYKLVKEDGHSHQEIAAALNISTNTIERQINEAMRTLRTKFTADKILFAIILLRLGA